MWAEENCSNWRERLRAGEPARYRWDGDLRVSWDAMDLRDWHYRRDNCRASWRWRLAALGWRSHSGFLREVIDRYATQLARLTPGTYHSATMAAGVFDGHALEVASRIVLAREERDYALHHSTRRVITDRYVADRYWRANTTGRKSQPRVLFYINGTVIVPAPSQKLAPLYAMVRQIEQSETLEWYLVHGERPPDCL